MSWFLVCLDGGMIHWKRTKFGGIDYELGFGHVGF